MSGEALAKSRESGAHNLLAQMVGAWEGTAKTWFEPDKLADESPNSGTIRAVLDGTFVIHEYTSSMQSKPLSGIATFGYYLMEKKWQMAWVDTFHMGTGILLSESAPAEASGSKFSVLGHYGDGAGGPNWGWRTQVEVASRNDLIITHYNITPQGEEAKAVEIRYRRKK